MSLKIPALGENALLRDMLGITPVGALTIKLFINDFTPGDADTSASYTEMASHGYSQKTIPVASWSVAQVANVGEASATPVVWTFTAGIGGPVTIFGYFVVGTDGTVRWAEKFSSSFVVEFLNDSITITPKFTLSSV